MSENKNEIPGLSMVNIKMDLARFQDDILKDIRTVQLSLADKYTKFDDFSKERITAFENKINSFEKKITELSNLIITDNSIREKIKSLEQFKEYMNDTLFKRRAKFNELEKYTNDEINRINNILTESIIYPSIIGKVARFKSFHEFIDYVLNEISQLIVFRDNNSLDLSGYKKKIDQVLDFLKLQMSNFSSKEYVDKSINNIEEKINSTLKMYGNNLEDILIEHSQYSEGIQKKGEEIDKHMELMKKMNEFINQSIENQQEKYNNYSKELNFVKFKLKKCNEMIKELLTYHPLAQRHFVHEFDKSSSKIVSGVKEYIKGNLNAEELSSMKNYSYRRGSTRINENYLTSPTKKSPYSSIGNNSFENDENDRKYSQTLDNNYLFGNNQLLFSKIKNRKKTFLSHKDLKIIYHHHSDSPNKMINGKKDENYTKNIPDIIRKNTFNFDKNSIELSNIKHYEHYETTTTGDNYFDKNIKENDNINEEIDKENIISQNYNNNEDSSQDEKNKDKYNINSLNNNSNSNSNSNSNREPSITNPDVIKEEDESEISNKNLDFQRDKKPKSRNENTKELDGKIESNDIKNIQSINNEDNNNKKIKNAEKKNIKLTLLKQMINSNITDNSNLKLISLKVKSNDNEKLYNYDETKENKPIKGNHLLKNNSQKIRNHLKTNILDIPIKKTFSQRMMFKTVQTNTRYSPNKIYPISFENKNSVNNNRNSLINHKINKTYTNFPVINKELTCHKIVQKKNYIETKDLNLFAKNLNLAKISNQSNVKIASYLKKPLKLLLINPDNIPPNGYFSNYNKNIIKNNSLRVLTEIKDKNKKKEN